MATNQLTATIKPMTAAQERAVEKHRAEVLKSWRAFDKARVNIKFETGENYNGAPATVRLKRQATDEGVSEYSLPGVYLDAVRYLVQCAGYSPARARRELGEDFRACLENLPEGRDSARRLAKAWVRGILPLAEAYAGDAQQNAQAGRNQARWLLVDGQTVDAPM